MRVSYSRMDNYSLLIYTSIAHETSMVVGIIRIGYSDTIDSVRLFQQIIRNSLSLIEM